MTLLHGRYEPLGVAGRGGQGEVLRAVDRMHDRPVVLKIRDVRTDEHRARLLAEARVLFGLRPHAGVPVLREDFFEDGRYVLVMDLIEGPDLASVLASQGSPGLSFERVLGWIGEVADALEHLHAHDPPIVHRDVKPANVVLAPDGRAVLVDFGIAQAADTASGADAGTPAFQAPEIGRGEQPARSMDVYGLAATTFALLTGSAPRPGIEADWSSVPPGQRERVASAVGAGLAIRAVKRPAGARAFVDGVRPCTTPTNLPERLSSFVGRGAESSRVSSAIASSRLVTVAGPGGVGKTRLAIEAARALLPRFPDGVWFADLAPASDPDAVLRQVASATGTREAPGRAGRDAVRARLATGDHLLVLDNCEQAVDACATLAENLLETCAGLRVLATSRERLRAQGEAVIALGPLGAEAVELFAERACAAGSARPRTDAVAAICERLDGLPLAVELAAAQLAWMTLDELEATLDDPVPPLRGGRRTLPRHESLEATLWWSLSLLDDHERTAFARLGVFAGGFRPVVAGDVCSVDTDEIRRLADRSLVQPDGPGRWRMLNVVASFARAQLDASADASSVRERHLGAMVTLGDQAARALSGPDGPATLAELDASYADLRSAFDAAVAARDPRCLRLGSALVRFWVAKGWLSEGRALIARALDAVAGDSYERASGLHNAGTLAQLAGDLDASADAFRSALDVWHAIGEMRGAAQTLAALGATASLRGRFEDADRALGDSIAISRELGDDAELARALANRGVLAVERGRADGAEADLAESLAMLRAAGDRESVARVLGGLGLVAKLRGDLAESQRLIAEGLVMKREIGHVPGIVASLVNLGEVSRRRDDRPAATDAFVEALSLALEVSFEPGVANALEGLALVYAVDRPRDAAVLFGTAEALRERIGVRLHPSDADAHEVAWRTIVDTIGHATADAARLDGRAMQPSDVPAVSGVRPAAGVRPPR